MEKKKIGDAIRNNLQKISICLISIVYVIQGVFVFTKTGKSITEIIGNIALSIIVGVIISANLRSMGLQSGRKSEKFIASEKLYGDTKEKATPYFHKLFAWCEYKNYQELQQKKKEIIVNGGLNWKGYKTGFYKDKVLSDDQKKVIEKADKCKIEKLTNRNLLSDLPNDRPYRKSNRFGESEREYKTRGEIGDLITKLSAGVIFGLYTLSPLITGDNWRQIVASMLWNAFQIILWLSLGIIKYSDAKAFMEDEYRQTHIIQKTEYLNEFIVTVEKTPEVIDNFNDEDEIDNYIKELINEKERVNN